jgi:cysteinyl-tRNA synthetase
VEEFVPFKEGYIGMYACGMTVYDYAHIGHGRKYINDDVLRRTLDYLGYEVKHVQNVTDVGHLVSDGDSGEDKLEKGAEKTGKTVWEVAEFFEKHFYSSMDSLNILRPHVISKATDHIKEQIELIDNLFEKGYAYDTEEAVYFDVKKFSGYGELFGRQGLEEKKTGAREDVKTDENKRNPADFALWFKRVGRFSDHVMHWDSPWGDGFPGWHVECSAMSMKYLGEQFDIHTGGEDHIAVHHPNEIAQSEGATGKHPFVKYWVHTTFLTVDGQKMSKSLGNFYTVEDVVKKGYDPLSLRYLFLTAHYRKRINFTWGSLDSAQIALNRLRNIVSDYKTDKADERTVLSKEKMEKVEKYRQEFAGYISDDLKTPQALAVVWEVVKSNIPTSDKLDLILSFDEVLGLNLSEHRESTPQGVEDLIREREKLRSEGDFEQADAIRDKLKEEFNYEVRDKSS